MADVQPLEADAKLSSVYMGPCNFALTDLQRMNNVTKTVFVKNQKYEHGGRLIVKIHILFYGDNS
jgi:hypothetical protein